MAQAAVRRRREASVENLRWRRPLLELEILGNLIDRPAEAGRVDAADAVTLYLAGEDVVGNHGTQPFQFEIAQSVVHPADDIVHRVFGLPGGQSRAGTPPPQKTLPPFPLCAPAP